MLEFNHILVADTPHATPLPGELVVWLGPQTPPTLPGGQHLIRARTTADAVCLVDRGPAVLRLALREPLGFLRDLAAERSQEARAA